METLVKESSYADDFKLNNGIPNEKDIIDTSQIKGNVQKGPLERGNENGVTALEMPELKTLNTGCECFGRHIENETETRTNGPEAQKNIGESSCPTEMAENEKSSSEDVCELRVGHSQSDDSIVKMRKSSGRNSPAAFPTDTRYISAAFEFLKSDDLNLANNENKENLCDNQNKPEKTQDQSDEKTVKRGSVTSNNICDRNSSASAISNISSLSDFGGSVKSDESTESQVQEDSRSTCNANVEVSTETPDQGTRGMSPAFQDSSFQTPNISVNSEFSFSEGISNGPSRTSAQAPIDEESLKKTASECKGKDPLVRKRSKKSSVQSQESSEQDSEDSSDEDSGVYAESHRNSHWIKVEDDGTLTLPSMHYTIAEEVDQSDVASETSGASSAAKDATLDEVFEDQPSEFPRSHKRSDSSATTASESEFRNKFRYLRKCSVQRQSSQQQFYRMSTKYYEDESTVTVEKDAGNEDFGLHILDSHPAVISNVISGSAAESAGVLPGQILVSVNGVNVLEASHAEIIKLIQQNPDSLTVSLGQSDVFHSRDLLSPVLSGFLTKLASSGLIKLWRKRWFVLRQDNCLYYYKSENDKDPLGAIPLSNYSVSKAPESSKDYAFKLEKYGAKSYFFSAESDASRKQWANAMTVAAHSTLKTESWLDVTSHNVGIPALSIRNPECTGYIHKSGDGKKAWKKRYCVLKDACIYYYKGIGSYSAQGVAHLHGYQLDSDVTCSKRHAFKLLPPEPNMRVFLFATENDTDRERWMNSMMKSIGRWQRISMTS